MTVPIAGAISISKHPKACFLIIHHKAGFLYENRAFCICFFAFPATGTVAFFIAEASRRISSFKFAIDCEFPKRKEGSAIYEYLRIYIRPRRQTSMAVLFHQRNETTRSFEVGARDNLLRLLDPAPVILLPQCNSHASAARNAIPYMPLTDRC